MKKVKLTKTEREALQHAEALKKFCKGRSVIGCVRCAFKKDGGQGCLFYSTLPEEWNLPESEVNPK